MSQQVVCTKNTLSELWWLNLYLSNHIRIMKKEADEYKFLYLLVQLSLKAGNVGCYQQIELGENMMKILKASPIAEEITDPIIYFPLKNFTIRSLKHHEKTVKIKVYLIKDKEGKLIGLDFWTSQWFWGIFSSVFDLSTTERVFRATISSLSMYKGIDEEIKKIVEKEDSRKLEEQLEEQSEKQSGKREKKVSKIANREYYEDSPQQKIEGLFAKKVNKSIEENRKWEQPSINNLMGNLKNLKIKNNGK